MLTYVSTATDLLSVPQLVELLEEARPKNQRLGITGMLLYSGGNVIQSLEGDREVVEDVFRAIEGDPRHRDVVVLARLETEERAFPSWAMGFSNVDERELRDAATFSELAGGPAAAGLEEHAGPTLALLAYLRGRG